MSTRVDLPTEALAAPIWDLHLDTRGRNAMARLKLGRIGELLDDGHLRKSVAEQLGDKGTERTLEILQSLAASAGRDGRVDWERFWSDQGVALIPEDDHPMPPSEAVASIPKVTREMILADAAKPDVGERAWQVVDARNGLVAQPRTLEEIGRVIGGLTRERIRQIQDETTNELRDAVEHGFAGRRYRLRQHVVESWAAIFAAGPGDTRPVVSEADLCARLGLASPLPDAAVRRLEFLFAFRKVIRRPGAGPRVGALWLAQTGEGKRVADAVVRVDNLLAAKLIDGATEVDIAIEATKRDHKHPLDVTDVAAALTFLEGTQRLSDGLVRARFDCLDGSVNQAYRLLADAGGPLKLDEIRRQINATRRHGHRQVPPYELSNGMSADPRFVAFPRRFGIWGLTGRDSEAARSVMDLVLDALRGLGRPSTKVEVEQEVERLRPGASGFTGTYLYQLQTAEYGSQVVHLQDRRWAFRDWPEAKVAGNVRPPEKRPPRVTAAQKAVDEHLSRVLQDAEGHEMAIGDAATSVARAQSRTWPSAYYYVRQSGVVEEFGPKGPKRQVRLREQPPEEPEGSE